LGNIDYPVVAVGGPVALGMPDADMDDIWVKQNIMMRATVHPSCDGITGVRLTSGDNLTDNLTGVACLGDAIPVA
jgi:hypothetical protein